MSYTIESVAKSFINLRTKKGVTQRAAALGSNLARQTLINYESAQTNPTLENAWKLADFYGCTIDELCGRSTFPETECAKPDSAAIQAR